MNFLTEKYLMIYMLLLFSSASSFSQDSKNNRYPIDAELGFSTGPAIGEKVPEFSLPNQFGKIKSLKDLVGEKGAVLNMYRSADW